MCLFRPHSLQLRLQATFGSIDMTAKRWTGTAYADIATKKRWTGSVWTDITTAKRWNGTAWVDITFAGGGGGGGLTISLSPSSAFIYDECSRDIDGFCPFIKTLTTNSVTITATGGTGGGPTYSWQYVSGSSSIVANSPTSATTTFTANVARNEEAVAVFKCVVTQGVETKELSLEVTISYSYIAGGLEP